MQSKQKWMLFKKLLKRIQNQHSKHSGKLSLPLHSSGGSAFSKTFKDKLKILKYRVLPEPDKEKSDLLCF